MLKGKTPVGRHFVSQQALIKNGILRVLLIAFKRVIGSSDDLNCQI